jgi:hypothetical protein
MAPPGQVNVVKGQMAHGARAHGVDGGQATTSRCSGVTAEDQTVALGELKQ